MSEAPERIFAWKSDIGTGAWISAHDEIIRKNETEYRRADLPPTDEECLRNEKVKALVGLLEEARSDLVSYISHELTRAQYPDTYRSDMELCWKIDAAIAAMQEVEE